MVYPGIYKMYNTIKKYANTLNAKKHIAETCESSIICHQEKISTHIYGKVQLTNIPEYALEILGIDIRIR